MLLIGATGYVGNALLEVLRKDNQVITTSRTPHQIK